MEKRPLLSGFLFLIIGGLTFYTTIEMGLFQSERIELHRLKADAKDNDWFMLQRVYPYDDVNPARYEAARTAVKAFARSEQLQPSWQLVGPSNIGGRISAMAVNPSNTNIIYAGAASGGLWKTTDGAVTWSDVFNESFSIGALALHPADPTIVFVGTGEANPGGVAIYPGNGIWKSTNSGQTWSNPGLQNTGHIGKIEMHPAAPNRIFVSALGRYRSRTQDRGVYRSTDGGQSWNRVLYLNDTTGACDVVISPSDPNRILAAMWTRYRPLTYSVISSAVSGLYLSTNGGDDWTQIITGFPFNNVNLGRISLAWSQSQPNIVYALAANQTVAMGFYKSTDAGETWSMEFNGSSFGENQVWYNNVISVHPSDPNTILAGMVYMRRSTNGGVAWTNVTGSMHVDQHSIIYDPTNANRVIVGNDGGVYYSTNGGTSWLKSYNLPVTQFYAGTLDPTNPQRCFGGTQDNGTLRTLTGSVNDWTMIYGGDGFYVLVDPTNPNRIYAESQNGGLAYSTNGGASFTGGTTGISSTDRKNWCTPIALDLNNTLTLYTGTQRIYRTTNGMQSWTAISADLTRGPNGRIGTITTIDVAKTNSNVIYVGADDGKVSVTTDGGTNWTDISGTLPIRWVTRVAVHPDSANVCYVTLSGYLEDRYAAHVYKTTNYGQTWLNIGGNLPDVPVNDIIIDPLYRPNLYIATDVGVLYSTNGGSTWMVLGTVLPQVPVHDLTLHSPTRKLLASTHGRSAFVLDLTGLVDVQATENVPTQTYLSQNYPNPFNPTTNFRFTIGNLRFVSLRVYDLLGREIAMLVNEVKPAGSYTIEWRPEGLASGVYFSRLVVDGSVIQTRKIVLAK